MSAPPPPQPPLPTGARLGLILFFACIVLLLQALDTTIVSTAIPAISKEYGTSKDVGWYGSAYFLGMCAFQIFWGRLFTFYDLKTMYIAAIVIFEIGSAVCGAAPTSTAFIIGRAVAGLGAGGIFSGSFLTVAFSVPLVKRPMYASYLGTVYGVASVLGPLIGGAFTTNVTWRWSFYINLPLGGVAIAGLIPFFKSPQAAARLASLPQKEKLKRMDPVGTVLLIGSISSVLLALQLGGQTYPWSDARIIALFVVFAVVLGLWVGWQYYLGPIATIPKSVIGQRSMAFASWYSFAQGGVNFGVLYYAPEWFQAVRGSTPLQSGLDIVTFVAGQTVVLLILGYYLTKGGYSAPFMIAAVAVVAIATGLLTTWTPKSSDAMVFGYLALYGVGQGLGWQQPTLIAQTMLPAPDIPTGTALANVCKLLGGTISVSVGQTLFNSKFKQLVTERIPSVDPDSLASIGAAELRDQLPRELIPEVASVYNDALKDVWWLLLALTLASLIGALGVEWRNVTDKVANQGPPPVPMKSVSKENLLSAKASIGELRTPIDAHSSRAIVMDDSYEDIQLPPLRPQSCFSPWREHWGAPYNSTAHMYDVKRLDPVKESYTSSATQTDYYHSTATQTEYYQFV
ncbi:major facilitator superfamily domain-containing protein [Xylaria bambusicola]|uniref:major facilitator superfamily domain-containing protein n=1 Tax=Xylaria bambusicola TaxID=326684 RepID=UPI0020078F4A|nr:major facilitator superfamily domain-containing protein [Xylaria bambusicola]KAI0517868.1 major facilitator superfamily domain-containing protein [Xylaria bambusicola]